MQPLYLSIGVGYKRSSGSVLQVYTFERAIKLFQLGGPSPLPSPSLPPILRLEKLIYSVNPRTRAENKRRWQKQRARVRLVKLSYHHLVILVRLEIKWWGHPQGLSYRPLNWPPAETRRGHWLTARCSCHRGRPRRRVVAEHGLIALYQWNPEAWPTGWGRNLEESAAVMSRNSNTFRCIERKRERDIDGDDGFSNTSRKKSIRVFFFSFRKYQSNVFVLFFCVSRIWY